MSYAEPKTAPEPAAESVKQSKAIYVGGLPPGASEEGLKEIFATFGEVSVFAKISPPTPPSRFCHVIRGLCCLKMSWTAASGMTGIQKMDRLPIQPGTIAAMSCRWPES